MRINFLNVENFKGITKKEVLFNPNFTVIIGNNGTGKSSILDALSIGISTILTKFSSYDGLSGNVPRLLLKSEIRKIMLSQDNIEYTDVLLSGEFVHQERSLYWKREQKKTENLLSHTEATELIDLGHSFAEQIHEDIDLPLLVYHSPSRINGQHKKEISYEQIGSKLEGYHNCLDSNSREREFLSWFKTYEDAALKFNKDKSLYYAFTEAITSMVPNWQDIKFHWGLDDLVGQIDNKTWLPLSNLSDGYKNVIYLVADLAFRAIKLNPHLGREAVKKTAGIVLIDEIDLHLHPKWQQRITSDLKRTFPKIQFVVTTHSPFIVQSLQSNEIINLDSEVIDQHPNSMSLEQNALFMGVESKQSASFNEKEKIAIDYLKILDSDTNDNELRKLEELIENATDPVFKAKMQLERLAKLRNK